MTYLWLVNVLELYCLADTLDYTLIYVWFELPDEVIKGWVWLDPVFVVVMKGWVEVGKAVFDAVMKGLGWLGAAVLDGVEADDVIKGWGWLGATADDVINGWGELVAVIKGVSGGVLVVIKGVPVVTLLSFVVDALVVELIVLTFDEDP